MNQQYRESIKTTTTDRATTPEEVDRRCRKVHSLIQQGYNQTIAAKRANIGAKRYRQWLKETGRTS